MRGADALGNEIGGTGRLGAVALLLLVAAGDDYHRNIADAADFRCANSSQQAVSIQFRHREVGNDDANVWIKQQDFPGLLAIQRLAEFEQTFDMFDQRGAHDARVVCDQDPRFDGNIERCILQHSGWPFFVTSITLGNKF